MPKEVKLKKYEDLLRSALKFTEADLAANESGRFSTSQVLSLKNRRHFLALSSLGSWSVVAMIVLCIGALVPNCVLPASIFIILLSLLVLVVGGTAMRQTTRDLRDGDVRGLEGRVQLDMHTSQNRASYYVKLQEKRFKVKKRAFLAFKNGDPYRIYYAPHTKTILSVEWLRDDNPFEEHDTSRLEDTPAAFDAENFAEDGSLRQQDTL